ncbi:hypothetical protein GW17_00008586 [Ensete ventricosum]|nr:hypothetical protein GW17_00008586 [Ensete ventricosum]
MAPALVAGSSKLRYSLRSEARLKDGKPVIAEPTVSSASKRFLFLLVGKFVLTLVIDSLLQPIDRMREELISYIQRHSLVAEKEDSVKDLLQSYNIVEDIENIKLSGTSTKLPEEVILRSDQEKHRISSTSRIGNLTPKFLNVSTPVVVNSNRNDGIQKRLPSYTRRGLYNKTEANIASDKYDRSTSTQKKSQKPRTKPINGNEKIKRSLSNSPTEPGDKADVLPTEEASLLNENKENMDVHVNAEANPIEEIQVN